MSDRSLAIVDQFSEEIRCILMFSNTEVATRLLGDIYRPLPEGESFDWIQFLGLVLLVRTCNELLKNLLHRITYVIQEEEAVPRADKNRALVRKLLDLKDDMEGRIVDHCQSIFDKCIDRTSTVDLEDTPESFGLRKEITPFFYYHQRGEEDTRTISQIIEGFEQANRIEDMATRPLTLVNKNNGSYIRYTIVDEVSEEVAEGKSVLYVIFQREAYPKCQFCGKDCTQLEHRCARCKKVCYCSRECQEDDYFPNHKQECKALRVAAYG